ncbi:transcription factor bHLH168-like [Aristolochia californica]|uniref:transcription factor bHLH168-like n=1 Tax=Aristolochia californica TaxID=171875 RepID=UPI0035D64DDC
MRSTVPIFGSTYCVRSRFKEGAMDQRQTSRRFERMIAERNRRTQMSILFSQVTQLLSNHENASWSTKQVLEQAVVHIENLQQRIEQLRTQRDAVTRDMFIDDIRAPSLPMVEVRDLDSSLEVVLVCESTRACLLSDVLNVLEEEGVEVVNVSFSVQGDTIHYIIHSQVAYSRMGIESKIIYDKLVALMQLNMHVPFKSRQV